MSGRRWRFSERVLLLAVVCFAILAVARLATREPAPRPAAPPSPAPPSAQAPAAAAAVAGPPPSPAAAELLARIRSCSATDLEAIVDKLAGAEALGLYQKLSSSDRLAVFSALPAPILAKKAQELLGIPESSFRQAGRPGLLASSLVEAAMAAPGGVADPQRPGLDFATALDAQQAPLSPRRAFRGDERKIFACLDAGPEAEDVVPGVLVRWSEEGSGALVYLHYLPFALNRRWNHVYFEVADRWLPGTYRVCFYRVGEVAALLAEGTYVVGAGD